VKILVSLTILLNKLLDKSVLSEFIPIPQFSVFSHPQLNPYPDWVNKFKGWGEFGTFTDYIIRKILLNLFPNKVKNAQIIAEEGYGSLIAQISSDSNPFLDLVLPVIPKKDLLNFSEEVETSIINFYEPKITWEKTIYDIYRMSCLDKVVRNNKLEMPRFSKEQIEECIPFFKHIEDWLEFKFTNSRTIYPNPILGHQYTLSADADLFIDSTIYEIKTVKEPLWYIENEYYQLFGYVSLFEYLKDNVSSWERPEVKWEGLDAIGYIFPLHLQEITMDISAWKKKDRLNYLSKLVHNANMI